MGKGESQWELVEPSAKEQAVEEVRILPNSLLGLHKIHSSILTLSSGPCLQNDSSAFDISKLPKRGAARKGRGHAEKPAEKPKKEATPPRKGKVGQIFTSTKKTLAQFR